MLHLLILFSFLNSIFCQKVIYFHRFREKNNPDFNKYSKVGLSFGGGLNFSVAWPFWKQVKDQKVYNSFYETLNADKYRGIPSIRFNTEASLCFFSHTPLSFFRVAIEYNGYAQKVVYKLVQSQDLFYKKQAIHLLGLGGSWAVLIKKYWHSIYINSLLGLLTNKTNNSRTINPLLPYLEVGYGIGRHSMPEPQWIFIPWIYFVFLTYLPQSESGMHFGGIKYPPLHFFLIKIKLQFIKLKEKREKCPPVYTSPIPKEGK